MGGLGATAARRSGLRIRECNTPLSFCGQGHWQHRNHWPTRRKQTRGQHLQTGLDESQQNTLCECMLYSICVCACVVNVCVCRVPPAMGPLSSTCRKLPASISHRSQPMVMQRRCDVDGYNVCAAELPGNCARGCLCFRRPLRPHCWNHSCHMANMRIRIKSDRKDVRTFGNRLIPNCGSIAVGFLAD